MSYVWKQNLVSSSKYSIKCPYTLSPEYICIHDTANSASAANEINYMISNNNQVSFHIAVDEKEAIQGIPFNRTAWHAGDGANGSGNRRALSIEICRPTNSNRSLYDQAEENAVYVAARLLYKYGLGIDKLKRHYDFSGKRCPNVIISEGRWEGFKGRVQWVLGEIKAGRIDAELSSGTTNGKQASSQPSQPSQPSLSTSASSSYKVGNYDSYVITTDSLNVRAKRNASSALLTSIPKGTNVFVGYVLYTNNKAKASGTNDCLWGGVTYNGKTGYINLKYTRPSSNNVASSASYKIKVVNCSVLNARRGAGTNYPVAETVKVGTVLTIVGESNGWLKTKSGLYISKAYTQKI